MGDLYSLQNRYHRNLGEGYLRVAGSSAVGRDVLITRGARYDRLMEMFVRVRQPSVVLEMDNSLYCIGSRFFSLFESGEEKLMGHSSDSAATVEDMAGRPELRNTVELMAVVYGLRLFQRGF